MIASTPGWSAGSGWRKVGYLCAYGASVVVGSSLIALVLIATRIVVSHDAEPLRVVAGVVSIGMGLVAVRLIPIRLQGSLWRVPRSWTRFGPSRYRMMFGICMGTGVMTALASPGLYAVPGLALSAAHLGDVVALVYGFAVGRTVISSIPLFMVGSSLGQNVDRTAATVNHLRWIEGVALILLGVASLRLSC